MPKTAQEINEKDFKQVAKEIKAWMNKKAGFEQNLSDLQKNIRSKQDDIVELQILASATQNEILNCMSQIEDINLKVFKQYEDTKEQL